MCSIFGGSEYKPGEVAFLITAPSVRASGQDVGSRLGGDEGGVGR